MLKSVAGYGIVEVKLILGFKQLLVLASATLLVTVTEGIFGLLHVECICILTAFE